MGRQRFLYCTKPSAPKVHQISPFFPISPHVLRILFPFRGSRGACRSRHPGRACGTDRPGGSGGANGGLPAAVPGRGEVRGLAGDPRRTGHPDPVEDPLPADHLTGAVGLPLDEGHRAAALGAWHPGLGRAGRRAGRRADRRNRAGHGQRTRSRGGVRRTGEGGRAVRGRKVPNTDE